MTFNRIAGLSGFVFVALSVVNGVLLGNPPGPDYELADVRTYVESNEGLHKAALVALVGALPFAAIFFAGVVERLRASDRARQEGWGTALLISAMFMGTAAVVGNTFYGLLVYRGGSGVDDVTLGLLKDGELIAYSALGMSLAAVAVSAAVPTFSHRVFPLWHGLAGVTLAVGGVLGTAAMVLDTAAGALLSSVGTLSLGLWALATSVVLLRRSAR